VRRPGSDDARLALARLLLTLPDLHRLGPYWHALRRLRTAALRANVARVDGTATLHEGVYFHRGIALDLGRRSTLRDRVRLGIDEPGLTASSFALGEGSIVLSDTHVDCSAPVRIGRGTHVGRRNQLFTHAHDVGRRDQQVLDAPIVSRPIVIGDDVMLFNEVVVLPGVTIGDGAVVAIRSVVTRDVPPYAKVAGIPARQIGERR
jgi:acetyltransferase-like isoleucine patch superfamily enzyme